MYKTWIAPLIFFQCYLSFTVILFFFGPWPWDVSNPVQLTAFLLAAQASMIVGYLYAWRFVKSWAPVGVSELSRGAATERGDARSIRLLKISVIIALAMLIPTSLSRTGQALPSVIEGVVEAGASYNENYRRVSAGNAYVVVEYVRIALSVFLVAVFPLLLVFWKNLAPHWRILSSVSVIGHLSFYLATGTNKGLADILITAPWLLVLANWRNEGSFGVRRNQIAALLALAAFALFFFSVGQEQREGGVGSDGVYNTGSGRIYADKDHPITSMLPDWATVGFESLSRYLCSGYYALSLCLGYETESTLGLGHSMFLARNADAVMGVDHFVWGSVPGVLETRTGYSMFGLWHSIYPWIASDVGLLGCILTMGAFSFLLAYGWGRCLNGAGSEWIIMVYLLLLLFYYIPANNQVFQSPETCVAFFVTALWIAIMAARGRKEWRRIRGG